MIDKADMDCTASTVTATPRFSGGRTARKETDESMATDEHMDICERLTAVEAALRLQLAAGTSHLQEIEMAPGAFGLSAAARPAIKAIRKRRNAALHVVGPGQVVKLPSRVQNLDDIAEKLVSELDGSTVHEVIATGKEKLKGFGGGGDGGAAPAAVAAGGGGGVAAEKKEEKNVVPRGHLGRGKGISALTKGARPGQVVKLPPNDDVAFVQSLIQVADAFAASW